MFKLFKSLLPTNKEVVEEPKSTPALTATELRHKASSSRDVHIEDAVHRMTAAVDELLVKKSEKGVFSGSISVYETDRGYTHRECRDCDLTYETNDSQVLKSVTAQYHDQYRSRGFTVTTEKVEADSTKVIGIKTEYQITTISW